MDLECRASNAVMWVRVLLRVLSVYLDNVLQKSESAMEDCLNGKGFAWKVIAYGVVS